jgi:hypothetical protein
MQERWQLNWFILVGTEPGIIPNEEFARARDPSEEYFSLGRPPQELDNYYGIPLSKAIPSFGWCKLLKYASLLSVKNHMLLSLPVTRDDVISWRYFVSLP